VKHKEPLVEKIASEIVSNWQLNLLALGEAKTIDVTKTASQATYGLPMFFQNFD
jgi:hypothetical protein